MHFYFIHFVKSNTVNSLFKNIFQNFWMLTIRKQCFQFHLMAVFFNGFLELWTCLRNWAFVLHETIHDLRLLFIKSQSLDHSRSLYCVLNRPGLLWKGHHELVTMNGSGHYCFVSLCFSAQCISMWHNDRPCNHRYNTLNISVFYREWLDGDLVHSGMDHMTNILNSQFSIPVSKC